MLSELSRACLNEARYLSRYFRPNYLLGKNALSGPEGKLADRLRHSGCVVLEKYWTREYALQVKNKLEELHRRPEHYVLGDYRQDEVVRIYHVERLMPELREFRFDPFIASVANLYNGFSSYSGALVYQHDTVFGSEKSHYHVDSFSRQFKAMMYLDDVDLGNGPFSYIAGSHKFRRRYFKKQLQSTSGQKPNVFDKAEISDILDREVAVCAQAGSLLLMDVTCIHRGTPQTEHSRSVLMNYIMPTAGDIYLNKPLP